MTQERILGADFMRAAACLLVLIDHLVQRLNPAAVPGWTGLFEVLLLGGYGVAAFFVLSGFLLSRPFWLALDAGDPMPSLATYAVRRAARILPGYWLALTVSYFCSFVIFDAALNPQLIWRYVAGMLLISDWHWITLFPAEINGPLWSISFEVTSYILMPLCLFPLFASGSSKLRQSVMPWLVLIVLLVILQAVLIRVWPVDPVDRGWTQGLIGGAKTWMPRINPVSMFILFAVGALAARVQLIWAKRRAPLFDLLALLGLAMVIVSMIANRHEPAEFVGRLAIPFDFPLAPLGFGLMLAALPSSVGLGGLLDNRIVRFVARISFGIYVWHLLVLELVRGFLASGFSPYTELSFPEWLGTSAIVIVITASVATISFYLLEQPVIRWARQFERGPARPARVVTAD